MAEPLNWGAEAMNKKKDADKIHTNIHTLPAISKCEPCVWRYLTSRGYLEPFKLLQDFFKNKI
jgi:hypothetical protein